MKKLNFYATLILFIFFFCHRILNEIEIDPNSILLRWFPPKIVNLGSASYPEGAQKIEAAHQWFDAEKVKHKISYVQTHKARSSVEKDFDQWSKALKYQRTKAGSFTWQPRGFCRKKKFGCIYDNLYTRSSVDLKPLIQKFKSHIAKKQLNAREALYLLMSFVQNIEYRIPKEYPFGVLPPALVVSYKWGDCDSKSLLLHLLLKEINIDSIILNSNAHRHAMLAAAIPSQGHTITYRGKRYAFIESTAKRAPLGYIHPKYLQPDDWTVVSMN